MITKQSFYDYFKQYKELNPNADEFTIANHFFNEGYFIGRRKQRTQKFDIPLNDLRYPKNEKYPREEEHDY